LSSDKDEQKLRSNPVMVKISSLKKQNEHNMKNNNNNKKKTNKISSKIIPAHQVEEDMSD